MARRKTLKIELFDSLDNCFHADSRELKSRIDEAQNVILEAGCGDGKFALWLAEQNPKSLVIGVDLKVNRLAQGGHSALEQKLDNVIFIKSQIQRLTEVIPSGSVSDLWITFPDPFPKTKHHKRRLGKATFLQLYASWLTQDGKLQLKTDDMSFFVDTIESLEVGGWQIEELCDDLHQVFPNRFYQTTFEREFVNNGIPINYLQAFPPSS